MGSSARSRAGAQCTFRSFAGSSWRSTTWTISFSTLESPLALMWPVSYALRWLLIAGLERVHHLHEALADPRLLADVGIDHVVVI